MTKKKRKAAPRRRPPADDGLTPPDHLDDMARVEWSRISALMKDRVAPPDRAALAAYCVTYSRWCKAEELLKEKGLVVKSPAGYPIHNPYLSIAAKALTELRAYLKEFGLTPRTRQKLEPPDDPDA